MEYNSTKPIMVMREYGRNIHHLVEYAKKIQDPIKRKDAFYSIVEMMAQLNPQVRNIEDYKHKLWDHVHIIAGNEANIDSPYDLPSKDAFFRRPDRLRYPQSKIRYRHYGKYIDELISRAVAETDDEKKALMTEMIGNMMKQVYNNSQKENLNDEVVKNDLEIMSGGKLKLDEEANLNILQRSNRNNTRDSNNNPPNRNNRRDFRKGNGKQRNRNRKRF